MVSAELGSDVGPKPNTWKPPDQSSLHDICRTGIRPKSMQTFFLQKTLAVSLNTNRFGGAERDRTADPLLAKQVLSQLSYSPISSIARTKSRFGNFPRQVIHSRPSSAPAKLPLLGQMVGPGRLELPTPRLSSVCSNQLSYGPILVKPVDAVLCLLEERETWTAKARHTAWTEVSAAYCVAMVI